MPYKPWGIPWDPSIPFSPHHNCPVCKWDWPVFKNPITASDYVIGFSPFEEFPGRLDLAGRLIIKCPNCSQQFYFYVAVELLDAWQAAEKADGDKKESEEI